VGGNPEQKPGVENINAVPDTTHQNTVPNKEGGRKDQWGKSKGDGIKAKNSGLPISEGGRKQLLKSTRFPRILQKWDRPLASGEISIQLFEVGRMLGNLFRSQVSEGKKKLPK